MVHFTLSRPHWPGSLTWTAIGEEGASVSFDTCPTPMLRRRTWVSSMKVPGAVVPGMSILVWVTRFIVRNLTVFLLACVEVSATWLPLIS